MSESEEELSFESVEDADEGKTADADAGKMEELNKDSSKIVMTESEQRKEAGAKSSEEATSTTLAATSVSTTAATVSSTATSVVKSESSDDHRSDPGRALDKLVEENPSKPGWGWSGWSTWGTSVLNTAASSVGTFTSQVGEGFYQVLETVESGLLPVGPDDTGEISFQEPAETAADVKGSETVVSQEMVRHGSDSTGDETSSDAVVDSAAGATKSDDAEKMKDDNGEGWLSGWKLPVLTDVVNKTSSVVQQTVHQTSNVSMKVLEGGIDVLEAIGRKTYDVLAEGEHGLKKTIVKSRETRPTLSQTLREAKTMAESRELEEEAFIESRKSNFGALFDDFQGLVQLEALEGLNSTSQQKVRQFVEMLPKDAVDPLKSELMRIKLVFDSVHNSADDDDDVTEHDFNQLVTEYFGRLNLNAGVQKLITEIHQMAVQSLAEMTACAIEHWHRVGQQLLLTSQPLQSIYAITDELAGLNKVLCTEVSLQATVFVNCLTAQDETSELITGVYLESSNASDYIRNGFTLLLPVLQLAVIKAHPLFKDSDQI